MSPEKEKPEDPRLEFMDMYEDNLIKTAKSDGNPSIMAMVETCIEAKKIMDPDIEDFLKDLENLKDVKQFLMAEYKPIAMLEKETAKKTFADYLLYCLVDSEEAPDHVDTENLKNQIEKGLMALPNDVRANLMDSRYAFAWGKLLD